MKRIFTPLSPYTKWARFLAILWTLLIFILCLMPGDDFPQVDIPFVDKWTHLVLFGIFSFLWLCAYPQKTVKILFVVFGLTVFTGAFIEYLQGALPVLKRSCEMMDWVADTVGSALGIAVFCLLAWFAGKGERNIPS